VAEKLPMSVAPSARSLRDDEWNVRRSGIYALGDPRPTHQPLPLSGKEASMVAALGGGTNRVKTEFAANLEWFIEATQKALVFHVSCHGRFDTRDFLRSKLSLANEEEVTLGHLLSHRVGGKSVDLQGLRLLTLASCETAILDLHGAQDEVRSLATGMMEAGARAVLASLWPVSDRATYCLMTRFAYEWFPVMNNKPPVEALVKAQQWLRTRTRRELQQWEESLLQFTTHVAEGLPAGEVKQLVATDVCPYAHPIYWAGFQITGW
jgi:CHAT domain-containing protein